MNKWGVFGALVIAFVSGIALQWQYQWLSSSDTEVVEQGRKIAYWVAPMDANYRRDQPGKSPMGMELIPVYEDDTMAADSGIKINPSVENNLGVRLARVEAGPLWRRVRATGIVEFDETRISHIHLRTQGWIERLYIEAEGERVEQGEPLFEFYAPDIVNAQKEYSQARRRGEPNLIAAAEEKLRALGVGRVEINALAQGGAPSDTIRIVAPQSGVVAALNVRQGMHVMPATVVMSLADLSSVWLNAAVFESQLAWIETGQVAEARVGYLPGQVFNGQVDYIHPVLDPSTRTLKIRLQFDNPQQRLKPNMYAQVTIFGGARLNVLSVPSEALIRAPDMDRVVIALGGGRYRVQEVVAGIESGAWTEIVQGLRAGDRVVLSGQFLLDSEAGIRGSLHRLSQPASDTSMSDTE